MASDYSIVSTAVSLPKLLSVDAIDIDDISMNTGKKIMVYYQLVLVLLYNM